MTPLQRKAIMVLAEAGSLTPEAMVAAASLASSPLYELFEWDDTKAAHSFRLSQARGIISRVTVDLTSTVREVRPVFVRNPDLPAREAGYARTVSLASDDDRARSALNNELSRIEALIARGRAVADNLRLSAEFDAALLVMVRCSTPGPVAELATP